MKSRTRLFSFAAITLLCLAFSSVAQAGPKVYIDFTLPGNITWYTGQALLITDVASGEVRNQHDVKATGAYTFYVQSGFGPRLYKFEWQSSPGGKDALQVIYQWIDVPSGLDQSHVVPLHVVTFTRDANKVSGVRVAALGSRHIERSQLGSKQNKFVDPLYPLGDGFGYYHWDDVVVLMSGCYSFFTYSGPKGNSRKYDYADDLTCIASDMTVNVSNPQ